jgi:hypothetical protein
MDKRCEPRFATDQTIAITTLGDCRVRQTARVKNCSGSGLGLVVPVAISAGILVRIELEDSILLGEAMYSRPLPDGYFVGVQLEQAISGLRELRCQAQAYREESEEDPVPTA